MIRRHEARLLRGVGRKQKDVVVITGIPERTLRRIEQESPVKDFDDEAEHRRRGIGRPSKLEGWEERIREWLEAEPGLLTLEILRRLREDGCRAGKSQTYELVAKLRPRPMATIVRFEGLPGEFSQHDFGEVDVRFLDGSKKRIHFFASRLKWSRWVEVSIVLDQTAESLVRALVGHFVLFGGVPLVAVFDRPKTIASEWEKDGRVTKWNRTFLQVLTELGVAPELCWPYQPQQKGAVENLVRWVKGSFFKCRRFVDEADLERQLRDWLDEVNRRRPSRATGEVPAERMSSAERARLRPARLSRETLFLRHPVQVTANPADARVCLDGYSYSMPPDAAGLSGTLFLGEERVRIIAGRWEAEHPRLRGESKESVLPEHRAATVAKVRAPRGRLYLKRQHLYDLGPEAVRFLTELVHRRPQLWAADVERLHELLLLRGDAAMVEAIRAAGAASAIGAEYVAHFLGESVRMIGLTTVAEEVAQ